MPYYDNRNMRFTLIIIHLHQYLIPSYTYMWVFTINQFDLNQHSENYFENARQDSTKTHLGKAHLISHDHRSKHDSMKTKRRTTSQRGIHRGGEVKVSV